MKSTYRAPYTPFWTMMIPQIFNSVEGNCEADEGGVVPTGDVSIQSRDIQSACGTTDDFVRETT